MPEQPQASAPDPSTSPMTAPSEPERSGAPPSSGGLDDDRTPAMEAVAPPSRRTQIIRVAIIAITMIVVWGFIIPGFVSYEEIFDALAQLTPQLFLVLLALAAVAWVLQGGILSSTLPGLSLWRGFQSWMILAGLGSSIPAGPFNLAVVFVVYRGWGFAPAPASATLLLYGLFDQLSRLLLPALALIFLLFGGYDDPQFVLIAVIGVVIVVGAFAVIGAILRSESLAERIGRIVERIVGAVLRVFHRPTPQGIPESVVRFRNVFGGTLRARGLMAFTIALLSKIAWAIVLIASLRAVGMDPETLPASWIFAVFAAVWVITILPISPGGAGVPELLYISMLTALVGTEYNAAISSGVFLYRIFQWFLPIPIGWVFLWLARRGKGGLLSTKYDADAQPAEPQPAT
jgi:uncharacterized membrane protein YbhN (UPF0104 family)